MNHNKNHNKAPQSNSQERRRFRSAKEVAAMGLSALAMAGLVAPKAEAAPQKVDAPTESYVIDTHQNIKKQKGKVVITAEGKVTNYDDKTDSETSKSSGDATKKLTITYSGMSSKEALKKYHARINSLENRVEKSALHLARQQDKLQDNASRTVESIPLTPEQEVQLLEIITADTGTTAEDAEARWTQGRVKSDTINAVYVRNLDLKNDHYAAGNNIRWTTIEAEENADTEIAKLVASSKEKVEQVNQASSNH
jgi:hypothetical protein